MALAPDGSLWVADSGNHRVEHFSSAGAYLGQFGSEGTGNGQFSSVSSVAVDAEGNVWVADASRGRVQEFNGKGAYLSQFSTSVGGQPTRPVSLAIDAQGSFWIADRESGRVEVFNHKGEFLMHVGEHSWANYPGQLVTPQSIDIAPNGDAWVVDQWMNMVSVFNHEGKFLFRFGSEGTGRGQFHYPDAVEVDENGYAWVGDSGNHRVQVFDTSGEYVTQFGEKGSGDGQFGGDYTMRIAVGHDDVWVVDQGNARVQRWDSATYLSSFGSEGTGSGQLKSPSDVALAPDGSLWVADSGNHRVEHFSSAGAYLGQFGSEGTGNGQFSSVSSVAVDAEGNVWVADASRGRVQEFNGKGAYLSQFSTSVGGQPTRPVSLAIDAQGSFWIADRESGRVEVFNHKGEFLMHVGEHSWANYPGQLVTPQSIDIAPNGDAWVVDQWMNMVSVFNHEGKFLFRFGSEGTGRGQFHYPDAVEVDENGYAWVGDSGNHRVQVFDTSGEYVTQFGEKGSGDGQFGGDYTMRIAVGHDDVWVVDQGNARVQRWKIPNPAVGGYVDPITASATDSDSGVTSLALKLTNESGKSEILEQRSQTCSKGACSLNSEFSDIELSERPPGAYTLTVEAKDVAGRRSEASRVVNLDPQPPEISLSGVLAERAGEPLNASSGELSILAKDSNLAASGIERINVERDHQRVASYPTNCSSVCQEVTAGYRYNALRDGAERSLQAAAQPAGATLTSLGGVSCIAASSCRAVGYYKNSSGIFVTLVESWNGTEWQVQSSPNPAGALESKLEGVACRSASDCTAVGYYKTGTEAFSTLAERWDGTSWSIVASANPSGIPRAYLYGVSCAATNDCWAVGKSAYKASEEAGGKKPAALLEHWNGSAWTISSASEAPTQLKRISCPTTAYCLAVSGTPGLSLERWNGSVWGAQGAASPTNGSSSALNDVSCATEYACTTVGSYVVNGHSAPLAERWNGSQWSVQTITDPVGVIEEAASGSLEGVSCPSTQACTAVGTRGSGSEALPLVEGWDGTDWALQPAAIPSGTTSATLAAIACAGSFECTSVGTKSGSAALIESEVGGGGDQTVTVEAVDEYGNAASKSIAVDVAEEPHETPECSTRVETQPAEGGISASEAVSALESSIPTAVASSVPTTEEISGHQVDPSYSDPSPNLDAEGSLVEAETSVTAEGGFTLNGVACITPAATTSAVTEAHVVNGDSAVFANTAPETETAIRPSAAGTTVVQEITGEGAPASYSWNVSLNPDEKLVQLPSGALAITRPAEGERAEVAKVEPPEAAESPASLNDAAAQLEIAEYQHLQAVAETNEEVVAVLTRPWLVLRQESIIPLDIRVEPDIEIPTEYTVTYEYPPFELNFTPESIVWEASGGEGEATASILTFGHCEWREAGNTTKSPCGHFEAAVAASYAEYWGNPNHDRNPHFPDYGENNCTNFMSQVIGRGGMRFMRAGEAPDAVESWWERATGLPEPFSYITSTSWSKADVLPRHLWQYELAVIDPSQQPSGWGQGDIIAYNWFSDGKGHFNHLNFVVGTLQRGGLREPLIANESEPKSANYSHLPWYEVKRRIEDEQGSNWNRLALAVVHTIANYDEEGAKKHDPANLYGSEGFFHG